MKVHYVAVYDKKAQVFGQLFPANTLGSAERMFADTVNSGSNDNLVSKHPDDFALFHLFDFDDNNALLIDVNSPPRLVVEASQLVDRS